MNDYGKRLEALIEDLGINDAELGGIIGADSPSTVGQATRRNSKPQAATCLILAGLSRSHADRTFETSPPPRGGYGGFAFSYTNTNTYSMHVCAKTFARLRRFYEIVAINRVMSLRYPFLWIFLAFGTV